MQFKADPSLILSQAERGQKRREKGRLNEREAWQKISHNIFP
jgi:hypothetical protein